MEMCLESYSYTERGETESRWICFPDSIVGRWPMTAGDLGHVVPRSVLWRLVARPSPPLLRCADRPIGVGGDNGCADAVVEIYYINSRVELYRITRIRPIRTSAVMNCGYTGCNINAKWKYQLNHSNRSRGDWLCTTDVNISMSHKDKSIIKCNSHYVFEHLNGIILITYFC